MKTMNNLSIGRRGAIFTASGRYFSYYNFVSSFSLGGVFRVMERVVIRLLALWTSGLS